jgi:hypothetical protein
MRSRINWYLTLAYLLAASAVTIFLFPLGGWSRLVALMAGS